MLLGLVLFHTRPLLPLRPESTESGALSHSPPTLCASLVPFCNIPTPPTSRLQQKGSHPCLPTELHRILSRRVVVRSASADSLITPCSSRSRASRGYESPAGSRLSPQPVSASPTSASLLLADPLTPPFPASSLAVLCTRPHQYKYVSITVAGRHPLNLPRFFLCLLLMPCGTNLFPRRLIKTQDTRLLITHPQTLDDCVRLSSLLHPTLSPTINTQQTPSYYDIVPPALLFLYFQLNFDQQPQSRASCPSLGAPSLALARTRLAASQSTPSSAPATSATSTFA